MRMPKLLAAAVTGVVVAGSGLIGCTSIADYQTKLDAMQVEKDELQKEIVLLKSRSALAEQEREAAPARETPSRAVPAAHRSDKKAPAKGIDLPEELTKAGVTTEVRGGETAVVIPCKALFPAGAAELTKGGKDIVEKIAKVLHKELPAAAFRIDGHTDTDPVDKNKDKYKTNWELSGARALAVLHHFIEHGKVDPAKVSFAGYGQYAPADPKSKAANRRVEIVIIQD